MPPIFRTPWWLLCLVGIGLGYFGEFLERTGEREEAALRAAMGAVPSLEVALASATLIAPGEEPSPQHLAEPVRKAGDTVFLAGGAWLALLVGWRTLRGAARDVARAFGPARGHGSPTGSAREERRRQRGLPEKQIGPPPEPRRRRKVKPTGPPPPALTQDEYAALTPIERVRWRAQARAAGMA